jgi:hypothetical protein
MIKILVAIAMMFTGELNAQQVYNKLSVKELDVTSRVNVSSTTQSSKPCPVMTETQRNAIASPANGSCIYNSTTSKLNVYNGSIWKAAGGGVDNWATATVYAVSDIVIQSVKIYQCLTAHTSGVFATDLAAVKWVEISVGITDHTLLSNIGTNTHAQIDTHLASTSNPHSTTKAQVGLGSVVNADTTTTANITDSTNKRFVTDANLTALGGISGTNTGDLLGQGLSEGSSSTVNTIRAPYNQLTTTATGIRNIETGNQNMLVNGDFEGLASTVPAGWTCTTGTCTKTTTAGEFSSGLAAMKIVPAANVVDVAQTVTIPSGIQKQGVVGVLYRIPATCTTAVINSVVSGSIQTTVPTTSLIKDDTFRSIEIPVTFGTTSAGIQIFANGTCTGNIFLDAAYVKQGLGTQNLMLDNTYTAQVTTTSGVVVTGNKSFISSCTAANPTVCTFNTGIFTVAPICSTSIIDGANNNAYHNASVTSTGITITTNNTATGVATGSLRVSVTCIKSGNDYLAASSNAYTAASANYDWIDSGLTTASSFVGFGTPTFVNIKKMRMGSMMYLKGSFTSGTQTSTEYRIPIPDGLTVAGLTKLDSNSILGTWAYSNVNGSSQNTYLAGANGNAYLRFFQYFWTNASEWIDLLCRRSYSNS